MRQSEKNDRYLSWLYLFAGGFLVGIFVMNIGKSFFLGEDGILNANAMNRLKYLEVNGGVLFRYVLRERLGTILLLSILATTVLGLASAYFFVIWQGVLMGMFITSATIRFGMKGILLMFAGLFPQQLLLIPAWVMLLTWCCQICCKLYYPHKDFEPTYRSKRHYYIKKGISFIWIMGIIMMGCLLECYVNPIMISELLNIF